MQQWDVEDYAYGGFFRKVLYVRRPSTATLVAYEVLACTIFVWLLWKNHTNLRNVNTRKKTMYPHAFHLLISYMFLSYTIALTLCFMLQTIVFFNCSIEPSRV